MGHSQYPATAWELEAARRREVIETDVDAARAVVANDHAQGIPTGGVVERLIGRVSITSRRATSASGRGDGTTPCHPATALKQGG